MNLFAELKRRNVVKVAIAYAIVGWLMIEVAATMLPIFGAPEWILQVFTFFVILGFPVALVLSWIYDITPEGIERTSTAANGPQVATGSKLNVAIIALLVVAVGYLEVDRYVLNAPRPPFAGAEVDPASLTMPVDEPPAATLPIPPPPVSAETSQERLPNSVAVLPFENLSPDPDNAYFAAGVHEEVLNQLAKIRALNVISRTSMLRYAGSDLSIPEIAAELNVETVMEGSVRYADGRVLVTAQLIDPSTDVHLWSESFNREFADIFAIQADIATNIANALEAEFAVGEQASVAARPTESAPAYALFLKAITAIEDPSVDDDPDLHEQFHRDLDQAIALDPDFALAHAYKALAYATSTGGVLRVEDEPTRGERARLAREHAERALALDPNVGLAHSALARLHEFYLRRTEAAQAYERAYELNPNDPNLLIDYSIFLSKGRQPEAALQISRPLMELSPGWGH
ncbi:MAG TPA: hypothetical protein VIV14_06530, partial [Gammaproteobacteria bacterium]